MRRVGFAISALVLLAGTSAYAQSRGPSVGETVTYDAGTVVAFGASGPIITTHGGGTSSVQQFGPGPGTAESSSSNSKFNSYVTVAPDTITFESSNQGAGPFVGTGSYSEVRFDVNNPNPSNPLNFSSTITPAGMGFYLTDSGPGCAATGSCVESLGFGSAFSQLQDGATLSVPSWVNTTDDIIAYTLFDFSVSRAGIDGGSDTELYSLRGFVGLGLNADNTVEIIDRLTQLPCPVGADCPTPAGDILNGFNIDVDRSIDGFGTDSTALGFSWDATNFSFDITGFANQTLIYRTTVISFSAANCLNDNLGPCLVAYAGFGDPIGRGGGTALDLASFSALDFDGSGGSLFDSGPDDPISGVSFTSSEFNRPFIDANGNVVFGYSDSVASGAVPEPATWMSLIMGFGLLGAAMRRRRAIATA